jgi:hypothetical protein
VRVAGLSTVILQHAFRLTFSTVARSSVGFSTVAARILSVVTGNRSTGLYTSIRISFIIAAALGRENMRPLSALSAGSSNISIRSCAGMYSGTAVDFYWYPSGIHVESGSHIRYCCTSGTTLVGGAKVK